MGKGKGTRGMDNEREGRLNSVSRSGGRVMKMGQADLLDPFLTSNKKEIDVLHEIFTNKRTDGNDGDHGYTLFHDDDIL